jgi:hypothetical protein
MKNYYNHKAILTTILSVFAILMTQAQVRIKLVNPATESVTLHNYGAGTVNIGTYWLCNFPNYNQLSSIPVTQGSLNLASGAEVTVTTNISLQVADSELGLYDSSSFGSSVSMQDYLQWGSAGHQREVVAVNKGIWTAGTFVNASPPLEYMGNGAQNGAQFWGTALGILEFEDSSSFLLYPSPTNSVLTVQIKRAITNGKIHIYNLLGKEIYVQSINSVNAFLIDVSKFNNGLYFIKISSLEGSETKRFIKQ